MSSERAVTIQSLGLNPSMPKIDFPGVSISTNINNERWGGVLERIYMQRDWAHDNASKDADEPDIPERVENVVPEAPPSPEGTTETPPTPEPTAQIPSGTGGEVEYDDDHIYWNRD